MAYTVCIFVCAYVCVCLCVCVHLCIAIGVRSMVVHVSLACPSCIYPHTCFIYRLEVLSSPLPESEAGQGTHRYAAFHTSDRVYTVNHTYIVRVPDVAVISVGMNHEARSLKARLVLVLLLHAFGWMRNSKKRKRKKQTYDIIILVYYAIFGPGLCYVCKQ